MKSKILLNMLFKQICTQMITFVFRATKWDLNYE